MLTLGESQAIAELADHFYDYLPGTPHPYADQQLSFPGVAAALGLQRFWPGGSKRQALTTFLSAVLESERGSFCRLVETIVRQSIAYRLGKNPLAREDIEDLNGIVRRVGFKIPALHDPAFLERLPRRRPPQKPASPAPDTQGLKELNARLMELTRMRAQERGFAFELFLTDLFALFSLAPRGSFRLSGEQIDGSIEFEGETYLVEARWQDAPIGATDLLAFSGKVEGKAKWSRGIFISYSGYSAEGLTAFSRGRPISVVCFDALDIHEVLSGRLDLREVLRRKIRRASETNLAFVQVRELSP